MSISLLSTDHNSVEILLAMKIKNLEFLWSAIKIMRMSVWEKKREQWLSKRSWLTSTTDRKISRDAFTLAQELERNSWEELESSFLCKNTCQTTLPSSFAHNLHKIHFPNIQDVIKFRDRLTLIWNRYRLFVLPTFAEVQIYWIGK